MVHINSALSSNQLSPVVFERLLGRVESPKSYAPQSVEIQPTSVCHFHCSYCSYWERNEDNQIMPMDAFMRLCKSICDMNVSSVYFSGGGEPLLHRGLGAGIDILHDRGVQVGLITNGDLLPRLNNIDKLAYVQMSLHGESEKAFLETTGIDRFQKCLGMANRIKDKYGDKAPAIGTHFILTESNIGHAVDVLRMVRENNFDYAKFKFVLDIEKRGLQLGESSFQRFCKDLQDNRHLDDPSFTNLFSLDGKRPGWASQCWSIDLNLLANINSSGDIYLCVPDIGSKSLSIGNITEAPLEEIWGSARHKEVVNTLQDRYKRKQCSNCRFLASNPTMERLADLVPASLVHSEFV